MIQIWICTCRWHWDGYELCIDTGIRYLHIDIDISGLCKRERKEWLAEIHPLSDVGTEGPTLWYRPAAPPAQLHILSAKPVGDNSKHSWAGCAGGLERAVSWGFGVPQQLLVAIFFNESMKWFSVCSCFARRCLSVFFLIIAAYRNTA